MSNQRVSEINNFYFLPKDTPGAQPLPGAALVHATGAPVEQSQTDLIQQTKRNTITTQKPVRKLTFDECISEVQNPVQNPVQDPVQRPVQRPVQTISPIIISVRAPREISYQWSRGLCEWFGKSAVLMCCFPLCCCDGFLCFCCCCPCLVAYDVAFYTDQQYPLCWCCATCCPFSFLFNALLRNSLREKHKILGSFAEDLLCSLFCGCCVNYQMSSEICHGRYKVTGF